MNYVIDHGWAFYYSSAKSIGSCVEQPEYNLLARDKVEVEYLPLYCSDGIDLTTWILTGKYSKSNIPPDSRFSLKNYKNLANRSLVDDILNKVDRFEAYCREAGCAFGAPWVCSESNSVIMGATKESQLVENVKAPRLSKELIPRLSPDIVEKIESAVMSKPKKPDVYR